MNKEKECLIEQSQHFEESYLAAVEKDENIKIIDSDKKLNNLRKS